MNKESKIKLFILWVFMIIFFLVLTIRFFNIQILKHSQYSELASKQHYHEESLPAKRGIIYDRNNEQLAVDLHYYSYWANPPYMIDAPSVASIFSNCFDKNFSYYKNKLTSNKSFVWLEQKVDIKDAIKLASIKDPGVGREDAFRRKYPHGTIASQLIGFTHRNNEGAGGIEKDLNHLLKGKDGKIIIFSDANRKNVTDWHFPKIEPESGSNIVLTLNVIYQTIVEEELRKGIEKFNAAGGTAVLMNPFTGEILSMVSYPLFDPNSPDKDILEKQKNKVIANSYEPGSIFKIISAAAVLEQNAMSPDDSIYCELGRYKLHGRVIEDHDRYGLLSFKEVIEHSSNIGMAKIVESKLNSEKQYRMIRDFGFGSETGINLNGEITGQLYNPSKWSKQSAASLSYGYEIGVTPIQVANAYCAIANGGYLYKPRFIKEISDNKGNITFEMRPKTIRKVISGATSKTLLSFLQGVVGNGTGKTAAVEGINVGGKTGTARMLGKDGKYSRSKYLASFAGLWPVDDPRFVCLIMIEEPKGAYYGSAVAAPVFQKIASRITLLNYDDSYTAASYVLADNKNQKNKRSMPVFERMDKNEAILKARASGLTAIVKGKGAITVAQNPPAGTEYEKGEIIELFLGEKRKSSETMPDLIGLSMRDAVNILKINNIQHSITGSGIVTKQSCLAGRKYSPGGKIVIECSESIPNQ